MANAIAFPCDLSFIESFAQELEALPPKPAAARHNVISQLLPQIEGMLQKGYTLAEGHARFLLKGIACSFETFRRHVRKAQAQRDWNREHQGTRTAAEPVRFDFVSQSASASSPVSLTPDRPSQVAVPSTAAQVATEEQSLRQPMAEPMVIASVGDLPVNREAQENPQQWVEPETFAPDLAQAIAVHPSAIAPAMAGEKLAPRLSEQELRDRFPALSTPRMSQEELRKHFNQY
jgi:hypothetical protein